MGRQSKLQSQRRNYTSGKRRKKSSVFTQEQTRDKKYLGNDFTYRRGEEFDYSTQAARSVSEKQGW